MISVNVCSECQGKGSLIIKNAYDPGASEEVYCEYCDGTGVLNYDWDEVTGASISHVSRYLEE